MVRALWFVALTAAAGAAGEIPSGWRWYTSQTLGVQVAAPGDAKVSEMPPWHTHVGNGTFKLNLFVVDGLSSRSAAEQKSAIEREPGFAKFTRADSGKSTWRFDYQLTNGKTGTASRINPGRPLDCGVYNVAPEVAAAVAASCAGARPL